MSGSAGIATGSGTGILYFSRVPRDMRPSEIRDYFSSRFGPVFRQKFVAEAMNTKAAQAIKRRLGKSKALQFQEGWLEFTEYKHAFDAARQMNAQPVEVKRKRRAAGEQWCVRCLPPSYRWSDLVTEIEGEKRLRRLKINAELQREREINEAYRVVAMRQIAAQKRRLAQTGAADDGEVCERNADGEHGNDDASGTNNINAADAAAAASFDGSSKRNKIKRSRNKKKNNKLNRSGNNDDGDADENNREAQNDSDLLTSEQFMSAAARVGRMSRNVSGAVGRKQQQHQQQRKKSFDEDGAARPAESSVVLAEPPRQTKAASQQDRKFSRAESGSGVIVSNNNKKKKAAPLRDDVDDSIGSDVESRGKRTKNILVSRVKAARAGKKQA